MLILDSITYCVTHTMWGTRRPILKCWRTHLKKKLGEREYMSFHAQSILLRVVICDNLIINHVNVEMVMHTLRWCFIFALVITNIRPQILIYKILHCYFSELKSVQCAPTKRARRVYPCFAILPKEGRPIATSIGGLEKCLTGNT